MSKPIDRFVLEEDIMRVWNALDDLKFTVSETGDLELQKAMLVVADYKMKTLWDHFVEGIETGVVK